MTKTTTKCFTVSDGTMMLVLEPAEEGGYVVTSPIDPQLITQAETVEEAFEMAYDAAAVLAEFRSERAKRGRETAKSEFASTSKKRLKKSTT